MRRKQILGMSLLVVLLSLFSISAVSLGSSLSAVDILAKVDHTMKADAKVMSQTMTLVTATGQQRTRDLQMWSKQDAKGDQMLVRFLSPADVKGTGVLMNSEDMWLYLPALGRVRRVASHAKKGSFMGSDLSYDDMEQLGSKGFATDFAPDLLGEDDLSGDKTYVLNLTSLDSENDYTHLKMWVDQEMWLPRRIEYYGEAGILLKVLTTQKHANVEGRWVAKQMLMEDKQKGSKTILDVQEVTFNTSIDDSLFTTRSLERGL